MRTYEALYIVRPELKDDEVQAVATQTESLITDNGGSIVRSEIWGKRKLAYEVKHLNEGIYILVRFESEADFITRLEHYFHLSEAVIRYLVVYFDEQTLRLEAEQQRRKEAEISSGGRGHQNDDGDDDDDDDDDRPPRRGRREEEDE